MSPPPGKWLHRSAMAFTLLAGCFQWKPCHPQRSQSLGLGGEAQLSHSLQCPRTLGLEAVVAMLPLDPLRVLVYLSEVNHSLTIFCLKFSLLKVCAFCLLTGPYSPQNGESLTWMLRCNQAFCMPSPDSHAEIFKKETKPRKEMPSTYCHLAVSLQCSLLINSNSITWQRRNVQKKQSWLSSE